MRSAPSDAAVAVVFPAAGPTGGVERVVAELLRFQSTRRRTEFVGTVLDPEVADADHPIGHRMVRPVPTPRALRPWAFRRAARRVVSGLDDRVTISNGVQAPPGDVMWVHSVHAAWLSRGTPAMVRGRAVPAQVRRLLPRHRVLLRLERAYFSDTADRLVLCTSQQEVDDLAEFYGVRRDRMHVVPNGFDPSVFSAARRQSLRAGARAELGIGDDEVSLLLVANEWHRKGLGVLLEAVARVDDPRLRVDLVGRQAPAGYAEHAARLGLGGRMRWHGSASDVARFYAAADVFVLPTTYEPFGIVIVEAMAMGLPVVVPSLAGASAAITSGVDGVVLDDPRDVASWASAIADLLDPAARAATGAAATTAVSHLTWDQILLRADSLVFGSSAGV